MWENYVALTVRERLGTLSGEIPRLFKHPVRAGDGTFSGPPACLLYARGSVTLAKSMRPFRAAAG